MDPGHRVRTHPSPCIPSLGKNLAPDMRRNWVKNSLASLSMYLCCSQVSTARNSSCVYRRTRRAVLSFSLARSLASFRPHSALDLCVRNEPKRRRTQPHRPPVRVVSNMASFSADPAAAAAAAAAVPRRNTTTGIVWFKRTDLRLQDHEPLALAHRECSHVAHVFCLDDRWLGCTK